MRFCCSFTQQGRFGELTSKPLKTGLKSESFRKTTLRVNRMSPRYSHTIPLQVKTRRALLHGAVNYYAFESKFHSVNK